MRLMNISYTFLVIYRNHLAYFTAVNYIFKGNKERCVTENRAYYNFNIVFLCSFRYFKAFLFCRCYGLFKKNIIFQIYCRHCRFKMLPIHCRNNSYIRNFTEFQQILIIRKAQFFWDIMLFSYILPSAFNRLRNSNNLVILRHTRHYIGICNSAVTRSY